MWFRADSGDVDPATFVHYMRIAAAEIAGRAAAALPLYAPEPEPGSATLRADVLP